MTGRSFMLQDEGVAVTLRVRTRNLCRQEDKSGRRPRLEVQSSFSFSWCLRIHRGTEMMMLLPIDGAVLTGRTSLGRLPGKMELHQRRFSLCS